MLNRPLSSQEILKKYGIGLTGGIACGKSTVSHMLKSLGYFVMDADELTHQCLQKNSNVFKNIIQEFGNTILSQDSKSIDRQKLGEIVFTDLKKKQKLESILHPEIYRILLESIDKRKPHSFFFYDAALIFEAKIQDRFNQVWLVAASENIQIQRLRQYRQMSEAQAKQRIAAQMPLDKKIKLANQVLLNESSLSDLKKSLMLKLSILRTLG